MKPFDQQTYYELLEIAQTASPDDIKAAYERALEAYGPDSPALYGLAEPAQADALRKRLLEAMEILTDEDLRDEYDKSIGLAPRARPPKEAPPPVQLAMIDLLAGADAIHSTRPEYHVSYMPRPPHLDVESAEPPRADSVAPTAPVVEAPAPVPPPAVPMPAPAAMPSGASLDAMPEAPAPAPPPAPVPRAAEPAAPPAEESAPSRFVEGDGVVRGPRPLEAAPEMAHEAAIANAEAALAQVASRAREMRPEGRAKVDVTADTEFNGEILRQVRQSKELSLQTLADRTRITARHLENVEADRYADLPATVYLRGMLMSIARELALDPLRVAKSYLSLVGKAREGR